jgi:predicted RNase H-like HicB family nuclease
MTHKYEIIIYWSHDDVPFVVDVPELPGCAAPGDSPEAALSNCGDAIGLCIDTANETGRPIPTSKGRGLRLA